VDRCAECGFDYDGAVDVPAALRSFAPQYRSRLLDTDAAHLRAHPVEGVWSALEYGCHFRDVLRTQRERIDLILAEDCPTLTPMGRDERVTRDRYNEQDPATVAGELEAAADALAAAFATLTPEQWERTAIYNYPTAAERSLVWIGRNTVHEGGHHLLDIDRLVG
jgi:DNA segregation ATPase FtsK/SpoIIIE, S-DNA-T family